MRRLLAYVGLVTICFAGAFVALAHARTMRAARCPIGSFPGGLLAVPSPTGREIATA